MNLTIEHAQRLEEAYWSTHDKDNAGWKAVAKAYLELLQADKRYAITEAPEGMQFTGASHQLLHLQEIRLHFEPCPDPTLAAVCCVTVKSVYDYVPAIRKGYMAEFGEMHAMASKGFTHYFCSASLLEQPIVAIPATKGIMRTCLKKLEG